MLTNISILLLANLSTGWVQLQGDIYSLWPERTVGILWPPPSQLFHSGGSPWLKCTPGQPRTLGWTAAACLLGCSGWSAGTHRPGSERLEMGINPWGLSLPVPPSLCQPRRDFNRAKLPRTSWAGTATPKGVTSLLAAKPALPEQLQKRVFAQISGGRGSRVWSSIPHLPPFHLHQLNALIRILSTVSPQGRIIISCTQTQYNSVFPGKSHLPSRDLSTEGDFVFS